MTRRTLAEVLASNRREHRGSLLVYLMVDAARRRRMPSVLRACRTVGVTGIELGFPFSDPIADGPVLQAAASRALQHNTRWRHLLDAIATASEELPVAVMTYANPMLRHGVPQSCRAIGAAGGSALIVPDLPLEESGPWGRATQRSGLSLVQMCSPATPVPRIRALARRSSGFLYFVSRYGTTGRRNGPVAPELRRRVQTAHKARPKLPVLLGFGIQSAADAGMARREGADGIIVGSAVEEILSRSMDPGRLTRFLGPMCRAIGAAGSGR